MVLIVYRIDDKLKIKKIVVCLFVVEISIFFVLLVVIIKYIFWNIKIW